ncbi:MULTISPECIES: UTP--glucose-1-phosphate uridylyltransferase [unclassified Ruegeria]|uniref:UTP--glucose-1-phosphate uridylyltransferase n=1 Tax=unclassified Ruegeria TaxID=2625375 RepID=UPI001ADB09F8|nr:MULTISPECIES: UTP--glucose-1-phosphate uridylyltransferase [unclassified Ruegeria]MBO9410773.1 UTP--glucose-1-phosphate uridylyltransferase [Ruegeria sp. R8_1]MBO9414974.1 UTP--glucose-1-phosphate uridylyltransferase [Ruegeria sp. R8_2]
MTRIRKAVFPVAGLGTRFLPATKSVTKEMLPLIDRPLIQYAVDEARAAGIDEFIFVTSTGQSVLEAYFGRNSGLERKLKDGGKTNLLNRLRRSNLDDETYNFIQQDSPRGLGHAVSLTRDFVGDEPFAVILPDDVIHAQRPVLAQMVQNFQGSHMIATEAVPSDRISAYGVVDIAHRTGQVQLLKGLVEKPAADQAPSEFGIVGRYLLHPSIFDQLDGLAPGAGNEIQLTDAIAADIERTGCHGFAFHGERFDCGSVAGYLEATTVFALERAELRDGFKSMLRQRMNLMSAAA